jgi:hypothetical protein
VKEVHVFKDKWWIIPGDMCQLGRLPRAINNNTFLECHPLPDWDDVNRFEHMC